MGKPSNYFKYHEFRCLVRAQKHALTHAHADTTALCSRAHRDECVHPSNGHYIMPRIHAHTRTHPLQLPERDERVCACVREGCFEVLLGGSEPCFEGAVGSLVLLHACFLKGPLRPSMPSGAVYQGLPTRSHNKAF